jgi:hypothetical protein
MTSTAQRCPGIVDDVLKSRLLSGAGYEPVPAPLQSTTASFANALAPSVNQLTNSLIELIPSPPPPPPPPTFIQALAPLEEVPNLASAITYTTFCTAAHASPCPILTKQTS